MRALLILTAAALFFPDTALGQNYASDPYAARIALGAESYTWEAAREPRVASRTQPRATRSLAARQSVVPQGMQTGVAYYNAARSLAAQGQPASRPAAQIAQQSGGRTNKPFNTVVSTPTVSPYLNLYREEQGEGAPNYYAFVRPQIQQMQANQQQALKLQQLERQLGAAAAPAPAARASYSGSAARYGDTGHFYGGWSR